MSENDAPSSHGSDRAPTVYLEDGTPVKVRLVGRECEGDVSGEGHYAYPPTTRPEEEPTVYFEKVRSVSSASDQGDPNE